MNILIADENNTCVQVLTKCLKKQIPDVAVYAATDLGEALRIIRQIRFDLVLCDTSLTLAGGHAFAALVCHEQPETSILLVTADTDITMSSLPLVPRPTCIKDVIYKPIVLRNLLAKVKQNSKLQTSQ